jgi:hypothetical protein
MAGMLSNKHPVLTALPFAVFALCSLLAANAYAVVKFKTTAAAKEHLEAQTKLARSGDFIAAHGALEELKLGRIQSWRLKGTALSARRAVAAAALSFLHEAKLSDDPQKVAAALTVADSAKVDLLRDALIKEAANNDFAEPAMGNESQAKALHKLALLSVKPNAARIFAEQASRAYLLAAGHAATDPDDPGVAETIRLVHAATKVSTEFGVGFDANKAKLRVLQARNVVARQISLGWYGFESARTLREALDSNRTAVMEFGVPSLLAVPAVRAKLATEINRLGMDPRQLDE